MAGNTKRVLEDEFRNSVRGEKAAVDQQSTSDRLWDSLSTSYGRKLDASNEAYDREISAADNRMLNRGMGRSSYAAQTLANMGTQKAKAADDIRSEMIADYQNRLSSLEGEEANRAWQSEEAEKNRAAQRELQESSQRWQTGENAANRSWQTGENAIARQFQTSERLGTQSWQSGENAANRNWQSGENQIAREFQTSERLGTQAWQSGENAANREWQTGERLGQQEFQRGENLENRRWQTAENLANREWQSGENLANREWQSGENEIARAFQREERLGQQDWQSGESQKGRDWQTGERKATQKYQTGEREATQQYQTGERKAQQKYQTSERLGQQDWQSTEKALDRALSKDQFDQQFGYTQDSDRRQLAMSFVSSILDKGQMPSKDLLALVGLSEEDAKKMIKSTGGTKTEPGSTGTQLDDKNKAKSGKEDTYAGKMKIQSMDALIQSLTGKEEPTAGDVLKAGQKSKDALLKRSKKDKK